MGSRSACTTCAYLVGGTNGQVVRGAGGEVGIGGYFEWGNGYNMVTDQAREFLIATIELPSTPNSSVCVSVRADSVHIYLLF